MKNKAIIALKKIAMKLALVQLLIMLFVLTAAAKKTTGQEVLDRPVSISAENIKIKDVLLKIQKIADVKFVFSSKAIDANRKITINVSNKKLSELLDETFIPLHINYKMINGDIVLFGEKNLPLNTSIGMSVISPKELYVNHDIGGVVTNQNGDPLAGVSVFIKGTSAGTTTDANGKFHLLIADDEQVVLELSFVGYQTISVAVGRQKTIIAKMTTAVAAGLDEVVIVGYSSQNRRKLTSAVATVSGEQLNKRVATDPAVLLQGQLPGLQVIQGSGEPGNEGVNLRIRGTSTFSGAGNDPLIIVDGLPGNLSILNPNDIESISLLKDAASCAIYGSRGANGVIVVKTKKGKSGVFSLQYNYNIGFANPTSLPDVITNSAEFMQLSNEAYANSGRQPLYTQSQIDLYKNATDRVKYPNYNWLDDLFQPATLQNHYLSLSGGKENTTYNLGMGYSDQQGTMIGFKYKKYTMDLGLSSKINKRVTIGTNIQMRYGSKLNPPQGAGDMFLSTLAQSPLYPAQAPDGSWIKRAYSNEQGNKNTIALVGENVSTKTDDYYVQGNLSLDVDILKGLIWETKVGANYGANKFNDFRPVVQTYYYSDMSPAGLLDVGTPGLNVGRSDNIYTVYYSQLNYRKVIGDHNIAVFGGFQQEHNEGSYLNASRTQYTTNLLRELNAGPTDGMTNSGTSSEWAIQSLYGNLNYDFKDKYLFGASIRRDGTSRLPEDSRWGVFYSVSGAWRISKENFLKDISWINNLKIRGSWGQLGNQNIGTYPYQSTLDSRSYAFGNAVNSGYSASTLVDPNLTWETTQVVDFGLDLTTFNNKLTVTADYFNKYTFDILRSSQIPLWLGLNAPTINDGSVRNKGFEFSTQYNDKITKDFSYSVGVNFQAYKNTLEKYGKTEIGSTTIREEGHPLDEYYMYVWDGIFQSQAEIDKSPKQPVTPTPGDLKIKDVNGDGKIDPNDRTYVGGKYPAYQYAVNLGSNYKGFDLNAQLYGSQGQKIYVTGWGIEPFRQGSVPTTDWRNRWTPTNPSNTMPKIYLADGYAGVQNYNSTYFLKDASFFRLKSIQLGYSLPINIIKKAGMRSLRLYFAAENVFTASKYPGLDPERTGDGTYVSYPQNQTFTFGGTIQF